MKKIAVFASGTGTNFEAIAENIEKGVLDASIELLVVDQKRAKVIEKGKRHGVETLVLSPRDFDSKSDYERAILKRLEEKKVEWIILAGYMRIVSPVLLEAYENRIINIHPSLLPDFRGLDAIGQAYAAHAPRMGVTIHYVDAGLDTGAIIAQQGFDVDPEWTEAECEARIHEIEHVLYTDTLKKLWGAKVLVIGSGGREHAIAWAFSESPMVGKVYAAPGNPGMRDVAETVAIKADDFDGLVTFVKENDIDLTFVGPEDPLVKGIADRFEAEGLKIFGPRANAAILEGSKAFSKEIMKKYSIPTAKYETFTDYENAAEYLRHQEYPIVLKADGLAAGKGVIIAKSCEQALSAAREMMVDGKFGGAGNRLVIEEFLDGEEFSLLAFVKDEAVYPMQIAQDHKRAYDNDEGENTGGMGAYTPVTHIPQSAIDEAMEKVMKPMAEAMVKEGRNYQGILYGGLMLTEKGVRTIEFNCRFGDPETEVILQALRGDFYRICTDVLDGRVPEYSFDEDTYLGVVLASTGYPATSTKGVLIENIDEKAPVIFHMGTAEKDGKYYTAGGRVLFVSGKGRSVSQARDNAYRSVEKIKSEALFHRSDIGFRALKEK